MSGQLLSITTLLVDPLFVQPTKVLLRDESREADGDLLDNYIEVSYLCNIQPGAATNAPNLLPKDEGEHDQPRIAVYTLEILNLGDFVYYEGKPYRIFRIEDFQLHGHSNATAVLHVGTSGARANSFVVT